ncbi:hypothetical protein M1116_02375 [Patescibacteria group bacterium]|nr:hypothetical protein [Patescibacteria group bacterium]
MSNFPAFLVPNDIVHHDTPHVDDLRNQGKEFDLVAPREVVNHLLIELRDSPAVERADAMGHFSIHVELGPLVRAELFRLYVMAYVYQCCVNLDLYVRHPPLNPSADVVRVLHCTSAEAADIVLILNSWANPQPPATLHTLKILVN